jgi:dTDP-glucose 4,6-dehydratase
MRCLITGGDGFIGSHCVEHLLVNTDWELILVASWRHDGIPERLTDSDHFREHRKRVTVITADLSAPLSEIAISRMENIDYIIHFAADSNVDRSIVDPVAVITNNVLVTTNVLELARRVKPIAFIQISTDEVYGAARDGHLHGEWEPIIPSNPYAASKAAQEAIAIAYWRTYGVPVIITNTMNNIGERQSPDKFIPMVIGRVLRGETMTIHADLVPQSELTGQLVGENVPRSIGSRFYLHARNHADACLFLLNRGRPSAYDAPGREPPFADRPDRWNVVGSVELSNLEVAQRIANIVGERLVHEFVDAHSARPGHDLRYALDGARLAAAGWVAPVSFDESLERCVRWYIDHPEWLQ